MQNIINVDWLIPERRKKLGLLLAINLIVVFAGFGLFSADDTQSFKIRPLTRYKLTFNAKVKNSDMATWSLKALTKDGLIPYEGVYAYDWQKITPAKTEYIHMFLTPRDGVKLLLNITSSGTVPKIENVKLEEITGSNIVINGDFEAGLGNYSGWNTHFLSKLIKNDKDKIVLKCQAIGYALTDHIPVEPGATYKYMKGSRFGRVLIYDRDLLRVDQLPAYTHKKPLLIMPPEAAYMRVEYCDGRTYRPGAPPIIGKLGIERVKVAETPQATQAPLPSYPGEIILKENSKPQLVRAAREIQHWVREISGKKMMVLSDKPSNLKNLKIYVGKKWAEKLFPEDLKYLKGSDGFAVRTKDNNIYIFSAKPAGTLFGAVRLIERNSDLIFARPRKNFGTIYSKNPNLKFKNADFIARPAFAMRTAQAVRANPYHTSIWHGRVGMNSTPYLYNQYRRIEEGGVHIFNTNYMGVINQSPKFTPEIVRKKYPGLYAMEDGQRMFKHKFICPTHPMAVEAMTDGFLTVLKNAEKQGVELSMIGVRVQDGWPVCSCDKCMQPIKLPNGKLLKPKSESSIQDPLFFSTRKAVLLNQVAARLKKEYPNVKLSCEAYIYESEPPAIPYDPYLIPMFCAYPTSSIRFPLLDDNNAKLWKRRFQGYLDWSAKNNAQLSMFAYYYPCGFSAVADTVAADWSAMVKSGKGACAVVMDGFPADHDTWKAFTNKSYGSWEYNAVEKWVMTRLMWDPTQDPQKLREYYITRAYENAAPEMLKFYNIIRKAWKDPSIKSSINCHSTMSSIFDTFIAQTGNEKRLRALLVAALAKAKNKNSKTLIERTLKGFDLMANTLRRTYVPYIEESTHDWDKPHSTFWLQALPMGEFKQISTWENYNRAPAKNQTKVSLMRDKDRLYVRFEALKAKKYDTVELVLESSRFAKKYYFSLTRDGKRHAMVTFKTHACPEWKSVVENKKDSYIALFSIPYSVVKGLKLDKAEFKIFAKFARRSHNENNKDYTESSITGIPMNRGHYMNYWTGLVINTKEQ